MARPSVGAEGIPEAESVMTVADDAGQFAEQVNRLYAGDAAMLAKLEAYPAWLRRNFSKANASEIILEDFGPPVRNEDGRVIAEAAQADAGVQV